MVMFRVVDDVLLSEAEFRERAADIDHHRESQSDGAIARGLDLGFGRTLAAGAPPQDDTDAVGFTPFALGTPLTIDLRHVYTGRHPKAGFLQKRKDVAVVSGLKDYSVFAASARALNLIKRDVGARSSLMQNAFEDGTPLIAYSPSIVADSLTLTIEFAVDSFPGEFVAQVGKGLQALAGVPLMLPHAGILLGAGEVVKLAAGLGDALFDGSPAFSITETLNFDRPGSAKAKADFRILTHAREVADRHKYVDGRGLVDEQGRDYDGDEPYVVISLDGKPREHLESFAPTIASAAILQRFFDMKDQGSASIETILSGVKLVSDMRYREQAEQLDRKIAGTADGPDKQKLIARRDALRDNIATEILRPKFDA